MPANHFYRDVLAIDLATMSGERLPDLPHGRSSLHDHTITYDTTGDRLLVFGGAEDFAADVYELVLGESGAAWRTLPRHSILPGTRVEHAAWFDPARNRLVVSGGGHTGNALPGAHVLSFGRRVRGALDRASRAPTPAGSRRPLGVVLYGSAALAVVEIEPASIRVGGAPVVSHGGHARLRLRDVDDDGHADALFDVDASLALPAPGRQAFEVTGRTFIGETVCGLIDPAGPPGPPLADETRGSTIAAPAKDWLAPAAGTRGPTARALPVRVRFATPGPRRLELRSVSGRLCASLRLDGPQEGVVELRPARPLAPGVYWARLAGQADVTPLRLVLVR